MDKKLKSSANTDLTYTVELLKQKRAYKRPETEDEEADEIIQILQGTSLRHHAFFYIFDDLKTPIIDCDVVSATIEKEILTEIDEYILECRKKL